MTTLNLDVPEKIIPLYNSKKRFIVIYGGRGSGKSWSVADFLLIKGYETKKRILCTREIQKSIKDSVHKLLSDRIDFLGFGGFYTIKNDSIVGQNGTEFIFKGLRLNASEVKSTEGIDYCWCEEAQNISRPSLQLLTPTIRKENSQIIYTYNPCHIEDPIHSDYTQVDRNDTEKILMDYSDNPFFPEVLKNEMLYDKSVDYERYLHIWEGQCVAHSEAQVFFGKWAVDNFEAPEGFIDFNYGADWGFSKDPTCLIRNYIIDDVLYIDYEAYGIGVDIDKTPAMFDAVPGARQYMIIADSARPETISHMRNNGFRMRGAKKGKGSIEDGIQKIRGFKKIIIHERCKHTIDEFRLYSWKIHSQTGEILPVPEDKHNHLIDALRYSLERYTRNKTKIRTW